jgi:hypothetical protein
MDMLQVMHRSCPTQSQGVFSGAFVTGTFALHLVQTSERVCHASPLPQGLTALRRVTRRPSRKPQPCLRLKKVMGDQTLTKRHQDALGKWRLCVS